eukprot:2546689-Rhodomonas_salina.4
MSKASSSASERDSFATPNPGPLTPDAHKREKRAASRLGPRRHAAARAAAAYCTLDNWFHTRNSRTWRMHLRCVALPQRLSCTDVMSSTCWIGFPSSLPLAVSKTRTSFGSEWSITAITSVLMLTVLALIASDRIPWNRGADTGRPSYVYTCRRPRRDTPLSLPLRRVHNRCVAL